MALYNKITKQEKELILSNRYTREELFNLINRNSQTINRWIRELQANPIPNKKKTKYEHDIDYFKIWSENMAYVTGFICADGNVFLSKRNGGVVSISLCKKDSDHLEKIKRLIGTSVPTYTRENNNSFSICSLEIAKSLIEIGVYERKSLTLEWINNIPEKYISHFIRGYFDGDGTIFVSKNIDKRNKNEYSYNRLVVSLLGTKSFLNGVKNNFCAFYGKDVGNVIKMKEYNAHRYSLTTLSAINFCKYIYKDSDDSNRLSRKYNRYVDFCREKGIDKF